MLFLSAWYVSVMAILFVMVCLFLILVVLIQKPKGDGLSGAFGGAGGGAQAAFGAKVGDVLTWFTVTCFVAFLLLAMGLTWTIDPSRVQATTPTVTPADDADSQSTGGGAATSDDAADTGDLKSIIPSIDDELPLEPAPSTGDGEGDTSDAPAAEQPDNTPSE